MNHMNQPKTQLRDVQNRDAEMCKTEVLLILGAGWLREPSAELSPLCNAAAMPGAVVVRHTQLLLPSFKTADLQGV